MFRMCETAIRRIVSLSGLRARVLHVGIMSHSSVMYAVILTLRRRSISQCPSLEWQGKGKITSSHIKHTELGGNTHIGSQTPVIYHQETE